MAKIENLKTCSSGKIEVVTGETIIVSPGHGLDRPNEANPGYIDKKTGLKEVNVIYDFCKLLYADMDAVGISYINLKQRIAETTKDFTIKARNKVANQIDDAVDAALQLCVHADANTKGYTGITLYYIDKQIRSKKIADYFSNKFNAESLPTRVQPDTKANVGSLGELRDTNAPAMLIEIGCMDTKEGRTIMYNREKKLSNVLAKSLKEFIKDRPNWSV